MSFSGRLSIVDSEPHTESVASTSNSIIPLSIAQRINMESPSPPTTTAIGNLHRLGHPSKPNAKYGSYASSNIHDNFHSHKYRGSTGSVKTSIPSSTVKKLAKELIETRAILNLQQIKAKTMREEHESQLRILCRQLLDLESGLRKTERELKIEIQHKDKKLKEQASLIELLVKKNSSTKCRDIKDLCDEAVAKIPQIQPITDSVENVSVEKETKHSSIQRRLSDTIIVNIDIVKSIVRWADRRRRQVF